MAVCIITATLGAYASTIIDRAGQLVEVTYDQSLMSINYARAASADFASMEALAARQWATEDKAKQARLESDIEKLAQSLADDLRIAAERSQSLLASRSARKAQKAIDAWSQERLKRPAAERPDQAWARLAPYSVTVSQQLDLLINYTAGNGFTYRQSAAEAVALNKALTLAATGLALLLSFVIAWLLMRHITGPVAAASKVAKSIAAGDLDVAIPVGSNDELGALLDAMGAMREHIKAMVEREVALRRSAQMKLAEALETSPEGIVVVDVEGQVTLANSQAVSFFGDDLNGAGNATDAPALEPAAENDDPQHDAAGKMAEEIRMPDGRWLRVSRSDTQDGGHIAIYSDISVLKDQEQELKSANVLLDAALDNMSQGLCLYNADWRLEVVNRRFCEIFGLSETQLQLGSHASAVLQLSVDAGNHPGKTAEQLLSEKTAQLERGDGTYLQELSRDRTIEITRKKLPDGGWVATYEDISDRRRAEAKIAYMARHDAVTGLWNRIVFAEHIESAISRLGRGSKCFAVLCLDLDHFKDVNDRFGHPAGDRLLRCVAERLQACSREGDGVGRLGGDEFAVLLSDLQRPEDAEPVARRIVEIISEPYEIEGQVVRIGISVGIAVAPGDGTSCERLLKNADVALYLAKAEGRGTWRFYEAEMDVRLQARHAMELDLRNALAGEELEVHYQPLIDLSLNRIAAFEALVRWNHPVRGMISPAEFIPLAEETGLIVPLGEWVLRRACLEALNWPSHTKIAVNVSAAQFNNGRLLEVVPEALDKTGLAAHRLELEITESVLLTESAKTIAALHELRDMGISISMDDFGTGYSSLSYLRSFPFDKIKIDQSFVRTLATKDGSRAIVGAVVALASSLGIKSIAEGVETEEQLNWLRSIGCDELQGYYFSHPVCPSQIPVLLSTWNKRTEALSVVHTLGLN